MTDDLNETREDGVVLTMNRPEAQGPQRRDDGGGMVRTQMTEDHKAASAAFVRKESPVFAGR